MQRLSYLNASDSVENSIVPKIFDVLIKIVFLGMGLTIILVVIGIVLFS